MIYFVEFVGLEDPIRSQSYVDPIHMGDEDEGDAFSVGSGNKR